jgi:hypothetical protein
VKGETTTKPVGGLYRCYSDRNIFNAEIDDEGQELFEILRVPGRRRRGRLRSQERGTMFDNERG